jgi:HSP20 family molecular chaperone IbpA
MMSRVSVFSSPFLLGFDEVERLLEQATKTAGDGYPPYNIERLAEGDSAAERLRITLAVAGFTRADLEIMVEDNQLTIRGSQKNGDARDYLHRGIAARQFSRAFVLADGMEVANAQLENGLLSIDLIRLEPDKIVRRIEIKGV